jgi:hypothetical protein
VLRAHLIVRDLLQLDFKVRVVLQPTGTLLRGATTHDDAVAVRAVLPASLRVGGTELAEPVAFGDERQRWVEAVLVEALVAAVAQQNLILLVR